MTFHETTRDETLRRELGCFTLTLQVSVFSVLLIFVGE